MKKIMRYLLVVVTCLLGTAAMQAQTATDVVNPDTVYTVHVINQEQFAAIAGDCTQSSWKYNGARPIVVDFNAVWCGPCRRLAPILAELAQEYNGEVDFYSIDVDQNKELSKALQVRSIPMLLICPVGGEPQSIVGLYPKADLVQAINYVLKR